MRVTDMIDISTVVLWNGVALILTGALFLLYWTWQKRSADLFWWYLPFLFGLLAAFSVALRPYFSPFWVESSDALLLILAYGALWQAARVFHHRDGVMVPVVVATAFWLLASVLLTAVSNGPYIDALLQGGMITVFNCAAAYEFWLGRDGERLPSRTALVVILVLNAVFQATIHLFAPLLPAPLGMRAIEAWAVIIYNVEVLFLALSITMLIIALTRERVAEVYHRLAIHDPLTGLLNRLTFDNHLSEAVEGDGKPYALLAIDIDHFKKVNDTYGHHVGDAVLVQAARTIEHGLRHSDRLYRFGGEEFVCLLPGAGLEAAKAVAERIRKSVAETVTLVREGEVRFTVSIGVAASPDGARAREAVMADADAALYLAKQRGRNRVEIAVFDMAAA